MVLKNAIFSFARLASTSTPIGVSLGSLGAPPSAGIFFAAIPIVPRIPRSFDGAGFCVFSRRPRASLLILFAILIFSVRVLSAATLIYSYPLPFFFSSIFLLTFFFIAISIANIFALKIVMIPLPMATLPFTIANLVTTA